MKTVDSDKKSPCIWRCLQWDPRGGVLMSHVDFKKYICRPVESKKRYVALLNCHEVRGGTGSGEVQTEFEVSKEWWCVYYS